MPQESMKDLTQSLLPPVSFQDSDSDTYDVYDSNYHSNDDESNKIDDDIERESLSYTSKYSEYLSTSSPSRIEPYLWYEVILDLFLLGLAAWAQFGYASFSRQTSLASINDPMEHYLYPHITSEATNQIKDYLGYMIESFSYADAALTTGTYLNMRNCRRELINGMRTGVKDYKSGQIYFSLFCFNIFLILSTFFVGSLSPWTGFAMQDRDDRMTYSFGATMFLGLMISYAMSYAPYIFSASKNLTNFSKLEGEEKKEIFQNVFTSKKGLLGFLPRSAINLINRAWVMYGLAMLTSRYVYGTTNIYIIYPYALLGAVSSGYQTFMSQGLKDYRVTFPSEVQYSAISQPEISSKKSACSKIGYYTFTTLLSVLSFLVFILRTLTVPSLYTGQINDPANNYDTKDTIIAVLGLLFGGYAAYQYSRFRYSRWQDNFSTFFRGNSNNPSYFPREKRLGPDIGYPNNPPVISAKYSINDEVGLKK